jgi:D-methionine transport system ATP-binding protein
MIEIEHLDKQFERKGVPFKALDDVSLSIEKGEIFAIIGQSGAGKSTLLRIFNYLERPTSGRVVIDGIDLSSLNEAALREKRHRISMIFQHFNLIKNKTVFENIALPLTLLGEKNIKATVDSLLTLVSLEDKALSYPAELSGGQKQRVAIARALSTNPTLLLCDEITSALDPKTTEQILALLKKINQTKDVTIVLITHEMDVVKAIAHRFAVMNRGRITEVTRIEDIFTHAQTTHLLLDSLKPKLPNYIAQKLKQKPEDNHYPLCQVTFLGAITQRAIISELTESFGVKVNILQANIDAIANNTFGMLTFQLIGEQAQIKSAFEFFEKEQLTIEVLGYVE